MAEVPFRPVRQLSEYKGKGASASRERFRDSHKRQVGIPSAKRYVICSPPYNFQLQQTDLVFVLAHSDPQLEKFKS